jgi:hypothetical protein
MHVHQLSNYGYAVYQIMEHSFVTKCQLHGVHCIKSANMILDLYFYVLCIKNANMMYLNVLIFHDYFSNMVSDM